MANSISYMDGCLIFCKDFMEINMNVNVSNLNYVEDIKSKSALFHKIILFLCNIKIIMSALSLIKIKSSL